MNQTIEKFGYPDFLIHEYEHWVVLLRRGQVTLGSLILACRSETQDFSAIPTAAFTELATATRDTETTLQHLFGYDKINYLMLMMVDPHVHFHVLPRYAGPRTFQAVRFVDAGWPKTPALSEINPTSAELLADLRDVIAERWGKAG